MKMKNLFHNIWTAYIFALIRWALSKLRDFKKPKAIKSKWSKQNKQIGAKPRILQLLTSKYIYSTPNYKKASPLG